MDDTDLDLGKALAKKLLRAAADKLIDSIDTVMRTDLPDSWGTATDPDPTVGTVGTFEESRCTPPRKPSGDASENGREHELLGYCTQCDKTLAAEACGPTHAVRYVYRLHSDEHAARIYELEQQLAGAPTDETEAALANARGKLRRLGLMLTNATHQAATTDPDGIPVLLANQTVVVLSEYQRDNLLALCLAITGRYSGRYSYDLPSPIRKLNTGDWAGEIPYLLGWDPNMQDHGLGHPNKTAGELADLLRP